MNFLPEDISSAWLESIKAGSKDRCYTNNDAFNCIMNMPSAKKDRNEIYKKKASFKSTAERDATGIHLLIFSLHWWFTELIL